MTLWLVVCHTDTAPTTDSLGKIYGVFGGLRITAEKRGGIAGG
jgi:hypothetical protein